MPLGSLPPPVEEVIGVDVAKLLVLFPRKLPAMSKSGLGWRRNKVEMPDVMLFCLPYHLPPELEAPVVPVTPLAPLMTLCPLWGIMLLLAAIPPAAAEAA